MNSTIVDSPKLAKIKKLNREIENLLSIKSIFRLCSEQKFELEIKRRTLTKLINQL
jgi:hypothetical protein